MFSPDGKQIAYVKYSSDAKSTSIWIMNIDGSDQVQVTDAKRDLHSHLVGVQTANASSSKHPKRQKDADLYVIDVDGNNLTQLTINKSYDGQPYWTTDGYIYFVSDRGNAPATIRFGDLNMNNHQKKILSLTPRKERIFF